MFSYILSFAIIGGLIAFSTYQAIQLVRAIKEKRKNAKSNKKENIE